MKRQVEKVSMGQRYRVGEIALSVGVGQQGYARQHDLKSSQAQLVSVLSGKISCGDSPYEEMVLCAGESIVMPPTQNFTFRYAPQEESKVLALEVPIEIVNDILFQFNQYCPFPIQRNKKWQFGKQPIHISNDSKVKQALQRLQDYFLEESYAQEVFIDLAIKELFLRILQSDARDLAQQKRQEIQESGTEAIEKVLQYIRQNIHEPISVEQLSQIACMSQAAFFRAFKEYLNMSPIDYINRERVNFAKQQLIDFSKSVTDICYELGYNHMTYFIRVFKKYEGITPKQFQKQFYQKTDKDPKA
ncbi:helix-turn-helix domain-containing protein [Hugenholtzia roseola]|uniref:helix-turn-helix domain-containing protein n=1 Tax=Hugenholtzia roseola TaxID=1002 RepID=UPI00040ABC71|nr:AraC family transcriptional regulator [Hugenholtzia roseola]